MKKLLVILSLMLSMVAAQAKMHYRLSFNPESNNVHVELTVDGIGAGVTMLRMPVWAPGYYLILDSPQHLSHFEVSSTNGDAIPWVKVGKDGWRIQNGSRTVLNVSYDVFADRHSVGEANVTEEFAFLPGNEVYMYVDGRKDMASDVMVDLPSSWSSSCSSLKPLGKNCYEARDFDELVDCPIFAGNPLIRDFEVDGKPYSLCVARPDGFDADLYVEELSRMVRAAGSLFGGKRPYDRYVFMWLEYGRGGLEHQSCQSCMAGPSMVSKDRAEHLSWMSFVSHEYYHLYNVKSIRPFELGPFDYSKENYTGQLWISEGMTCYYEDIILAHAGLCSSEELREALLDYIRSTEQTAGRKEMSMWTSSYDIWLNFFNSDANHGDVTISYYVKGPVVAFMMDLAIRNASQNRGSLDDVMRILYERYYEQEGRGFHPEEFWAVVKEVAEGKDISDLKALEMTADEIDYDRYLGYAGLSLDRENWKFVETEKPSALQLAIRKGVFVE